MNIYCENNVTRSMNKEWHVRYQYLLMEITFSMRALCNGNDIEFVARLHRNRIARHCAELVNLPDRSIMPRDPD